MTTITNPFARSPRALARLPRLIRLYIFNCLCGFGAAAVFTALVVIYNVGNIGHLVTSVQGGVLALGVFFVLNGIVFAGVQSSIAVMLLHAED